MDVKRLVMIGLIAVWLGVPSFVFVYQLNDQTEGTYVHDIVDTVRSGWHSLFDD